MSETARLAKAFRAWQAEHPVADFAVGMVPGVGTAYGAASAAAAHADPDASGLDRTLQTASMLPFGKLLKPAKAGIVASTRGVRNLLAERNRKILDYFRATGKGDGHKQIPEIKTWADKFDSMRTEIDDSVSKFTPPALKGTYKLSTLLDHPELYKAYPHLKDMIVDARKFSGKEKHYGGKYAGTTHEVSDLSHIKLNMLRSEKDMFDTILHEVQHAVQHKEGMIGETMFPPMRRGKHAFKDYLNRDGEIESRVVEQRKNWTAAERDAAPFPNSHELEATRLRYLQSVDPNMDNTDLYWSNFDDLKNAVKVQKRIARGPTSQIVPPKTAFANALDALMNRPASGND